MSVLECPACGAPIKSVIGTAFLECDYCGSRCTREDAIPGTGPTCESLTMRGEIHLASGQWAAATRCFQRALEIAPMHAPAYYGNLLAALNCKDDGELSTRSPSFRDHPDFQNALRFADDALRRKLEAALRKAEENEAHRLEQARLKEEARRAKDAKKAEMLARHQQEYQALIDRNRRKMWRMWLLSIGTLFIHLIIYAVIESAVDQFFGYNLLGSVVDEILTYGSGAIVFSIPAMILMTTVMLHKAYGRAQEQKFFTLSLLCLAISLLSYLACVYGALVSIVHFPWLIVPLLVLILPCAVVYPIIFTARNKIKPLPQLKEEQRRELDELYASKP